jgi:uncharacterized membrane protein YbhN (UPF0104 family)
MVMTRSILQKAQRTWRAIFGGVMHGGAGPLFLRTFGSLVAIGLLIYLLSQQGWDQILAVVRRIPPWRLVAALLLMLISRLAVAARWHVLLRSARTGMPFSQSLRITFAGLFAANFLPTTVGGDVVRLAGAIQNKVDAAVSAASLVTDRLVGMAGMAMTLPLGLLELRELQNWQPPVTQSPLSAGAAVMPLLTWSKSLFGKAGRLSREILDALGLWVRQPGALLLALGFSWIHMLSTFLALELLFTGMGESLSLAAIAGLYSLVYFVTLAPVSINGYGVQELSLTYLFAHVGGVSESSAFAVALLYRTLMLLASLPGAAFLPGLLPGVKKQRAISGDTQPSPQRDESTGRF